MEHGIPHELAFRPDGGRFDRDHRLFDRGRQLALFAKPFYPLRATISGERHYLGKI
jgi:hypothetical protein